MSTVVSNPVPLGSGVADATTIENDLRFLIVQSISATLVLQEAPLALVKSNILSASLQAANNLSDLVDAAAAKLNLGIRDLNYVAGISAPVGTLGNVGDFAFNDNFEWYEKTAATTWTLRVNAVTAAELTTATSGLLTQATADTRYAPLEGGAQSGLRYTYSATTTFPSASGEVRLNNATIANVTQININESDRNSASNAGVLDIVSTGSRIQIALENNEEIYAWFRVTGTVIDNGTNRTIPVAFISSIGTLTAGEVSIGLFGGAGGSAGSVPVGSIYYQWATSTTASDPTAGFIGSNNASLDSSTIIRISETDVGSSGRSALLSQISAGGILRIQKVADGAYVDFTVTTNTDNGAWRSIAVSYSAGSNTPVISLAASDSVVLAWLPPLLTPPLPGGYTGIKYAYSDSDPPTSTGEVRTIQTSLNVASMVAISAADDNGDSTTDTLARLRPGAIFTIAKDDNNFIRFEATSEYASGSVSVTVKAEQGIIANTDTVYLLIISDSPQRGEAKTVGSNPVIPALNATATYTIDLSGQAIGHYYGFSGISGALIVTATPSLTTVTLENVSVTPGTPVPANTTLFPIGKPGTKGDIGLTGAAGAAGVPRGTWNGTTNYVAGDIVDIDGGSYSAKSTVPLNTTPPNATYWQLIALRGATGGLTARQTATISTGVINAGQTFSGTVLLAKSTDIVIIQSTNNTPCRVRLYDSIASRTSDQARAPGTAPGVQIGVVEVILTAIVPSIKCTPINGYRLINVESSPTDSVPILVTNNSASAIDPSIEIIYIKQEL
ncbi:MAG: hypothetical protein ACRCZS_10450 [Chroococcidiopsis sp.]